MKRSVCYDKKRVRTTNLTAVSPEAAEAAEADKVRQTDYLSNHVISSMIIRNLLLSLCCHHFAKKSPSHSNFSPSDYTFSDITISLVAYPEFTLDLPPNSLPTENNKVRLTPQLVASGCLTTSDREALIRNPRRSRK